MGTLKLKTGSIYINIPPNEILGYKSNKISTSSIGGGKL